jgi:hypothetical protein
MVGMDRDRMRAGDSDREAVARQLRSALDEGRLDIHEYDERLQQTYAAKTFADLAGLTDDLPGTVPPGRAALAPQPPPAAPAAGPGSGPAIGAVNRPGGPPWVASYAGVVLFCVIIWAISCLASGKWIYPWPLWTLIPLVLGMVRRMGGGRGR